VGRDHLQEPKRAKSETEMPQLPVAMAFYQVARDYDQDRAKEDLTDNNLRIAREANPPQGGWAYVAMTEQHAPPNVIKRVKDEFKIPREARGIVLDHGRRGAAPDLRTTARGLDARQSRSATNLPSTRTSGA